MSATFTACSRTGDTGINNEYIDEVGQRLDKILIWSISIRFLSHSNEYCFPVGKKLSWSGNKWQASINGLRTAKKGAIC